MWLRIVQSSEPERLALLPDVKVTPAWGEDRLPRYNAAPRQRLWALRQNPRTNLRSLDRLVWGLLPHGSAGPEIQPRPLFAFSETITGQPLFSAAYARRRCVVPVDAFIMRVRAGSAHQPVAVARSRQGPFGLAAIWENWENPRSGEWVRSVAILTCAANRLLAPVYHRMPAIIDDGDLEKWLSPTETDPRALLVPRPSEDLRRWAISDRASDPDNDDPAILEPLDPGSAPDG